MNPLYRLFLGVAAILAALPAHSAVSCGITSNPAELKVLYAAFWSTAYLQGTVNLACTRDPNDPPNYNIWVGLDQTTGGRTARLETNAAATIGYEIYHGNSAQGTWTSAGNGVAPGSTSNGAISDQLRFNQGTTDTASYAFYLQVPAWQLFKTAGVYTDTVSIVVRRNNSGGTLVATDTLQVYISVPKTCRFSTPPTAIDVNYPAFSPTVVTGRSDFAITCTQGTDYQLELDQARSVVPGVGLAYGLTLNTTDATGNAVAQPYRVNISIDAGQAGQCNTAVCSGIDTRTLTVRY
jgi:spore coat protein U-like protein